MKILLQSYSVDASVHLFNIQHVRSAVQIRARGDAPLRRIIAELGGWPVAQPDWQPPAFSVETLLGRLRGEFGEPVLMELFVGADDKNSSANILQLDQLVLALPSRDYYLKASSEGDLEAYHKYMTASAVLLGANADTVAEEMSAVVKLEQRLASVSVGIGGWHYEPDESIFI